MMDTFRYNLSNRLLWLAVAVLPYGAVRGELVILLDNRTGNPYEDAPDPEDQDGDGMPF